MNEVPPWLMVTVLWFCYLISKSWHHETAFEKVFFQLFPTNGIMYQIFVKFSQ